MGDLIAGDSSGEGMIARIRAALGEATFRAGGGSGEIRYDDEGKCLARLAAAAKTTGAGVARGQVAERKWQMKWGRHACLPKLLWRAEYADPYLQLLATFVFPLPRPRRGSGRWCRGIAGN